MGITVGGITVGQSPRDDIIPDIRAITGPEVNILECGALDDLLVDDIRRLAPDEGDVVLTSRLRDGTSVTFGKKFVVPRLQCCIRKLEAAEVDMIAVLGTGVFPELRSTKLLLRPSRLLEQMVAAIIDHEPVAVVTPLQTQLDQTRLKWVNRGVNVIVDHALPYAGRSEIVTVAKRLAQRKVDLIVLDCIGFTRSMRQIVRDITQTPVLLPITLLARTIVELTC